MLKCKKEKLSRVSEIVAEFEERYHMGEVSSLVNVINPQWGYRFAPLTENSQGIVLQTTSRGIFVSLAKDWF